MVVMNRVTEQDTTAACENNNSIIAMNIKRQLKENVASQFTPFSSVDGILLGLCRFGNPQEPHLRSEVGSIPDVRKGRLGVTRRARCHTLPGRRQVVMDVLG